MIRNAIVALILLLLVLGVADARVPQVGDNVLIQSGIGLHAGEIMSIGDGFICISGFVGGAESGAPKDICIGIGTISELTWI